MSNFNCHRCGACCRVAGGILKFLPMMFATLFKPDETGACCHLKQDDDGRYMCDIYEHRPKICRVEWMARNNAHILNLTEQAYYELSGDACKKLRELEKEVKRHDDVSKI